MPIITPEIKAFDKELTKLAAAYKSNTTPNNLHIIQNKILKANPKELEKDCGIMGFSYDYRKKDHTETIQKLNELSVPRGQLKNLFKEKIKESKLKLQMLGSLGTNEFADKSEDLYGYPNKKLIDKAYSILELKSSPKGQSIKTADAKKILRSKLKEMQIPWKIKTKKLINYANISPSKETITLSSNHTYSEKTINRLAIHEIGTHGVRYMNARLQPLKIFKNFPNYLATEEGLAAFNEEINGFLNNDTLRRYAGRVVAIEYAQNHNLIETYQFLQKYFEDANAFSIAMRVKRGLPNSESLGAFTKDHVYLKGFFDIKKYVEKNPLRYLYFGKVGVEYIKLIKKLEPELAQIAYFPPLVTNFDKKSELLE